MKISPYFLLVVNAILAIGLTVASVQYIQPKNCYNFCDPSYVIPCLKGSCYFGDQKAGWPFPVFIDSPGGGSPTGGWGLLGPEDPPSPLSMIGDVLFYSILVWIILYIIPLFRRKAALPLKLSLKSLSLNVLFAMGLWLIYFIFGFTMGFHMVGRGYRGSVYVEIPGDTGSAMTFEPTVPVPLAEVIDYYGDPDYVEFTRSSPTENPGTDLLLYWDSVPMFVELPPIEDFPYSIDRRIKIERIIFDDDRRVIAIAGEPISEEKTVWIGYGDYEP